MAEKKRQSYELPLDGKLITSVDPTKIGQNYQQLTNMRYAPSGQPIAVGGMSKITSSQINATYFKVRSAIHFQKDQPSESHVLVEAYDTGLTASRILQNTTAIPSTGEFSATSLYTPSGSSAGRWSLAPDGDVAYCNGEESCIWGGTEREIAGFISYDPGGSFLYDYTEQVRNTRNDAQSNAVLNSTGAGNDGNTMLLLHLDNNVTDSSPTTAHTITNNNVTFTGTGAVFGTHRAVFTTNASLTVPDDADFDFSGGTFTIDGNFELDDLSSDYSLYYQNTTNDDNSFNLMVDTNGAVLVRIKSGGTKQFTGASDFSTANGVISTGTNYHIQLVESGNNWYIFVDGILKGYTSDAARAANYTGLVQIGYDGTTYLEGKIDEYRVSDSARHTSNFEKPTEAYSANTTQAYLYVGAIRPIDGFKLYMDTVNASTSTMTAFYWDGDSWEAVSNLSDGTASGGISLAQTGTVTFDSTVSTAKIKYINGVVVYWYKVVIDAVDAGVDVYNATISTPFQEIVDIWNGIPELLNSFQIYDNSTYNDNTLNVRENVYVSTDSGTYAELDSLATGTDYYICGFSSRTTGVFINFVSGKVNTTSGTFVAVSYWDGETWVDLGAVDDGTFEGGVSHAKTGAITWDSPAYQNEFTTEINNSAQLYYYKFTFTQNLSADVQVYNITGIPAQKLISDYKFPFFSNDRLMLCSDQKGKKNSVLVSAQNTSSVFNGFDSVEYLFGDEKEIVGAAWLYSQYGSSIFNVILFFKKNEIWALVGNGPSDWVKYRVSETVGCVDPETIKVIDIPPQTSQTLNRNIVQFRASDGVYMSDGRSPIKLSDDISDKFDKRESTMVNDDVASFSMWDEANKCYHWCYAEGSATTLDKELILDLEKPGWFEIDRTTDKKLQYAIEVKDTNGATYNYGFNDEGYMYRLENGNDFDGQSIQCTLHTGDMVLAGGNIPVESDAEYFCLMAVAKTTTANKITFTHYGDSKATGTSWTESPQKSGYRIIYPVEHRKLGAHVFHSIKMVISTDDETTGFEPLYYYILYSVKRDHLTDYRS